MNLQKLRLWILAVSAIFIVISCGAGEEGEDDSSGSQSLEGFTINFVSPAENQLYSQPDPRLVYSISESDTGIEVPSERVGISVHDLVDDERANSLALEDTSSDTNLPYLNDGLHELQFTVNNEAGEQVLEISIRFATASAPVADAGADLSVRPGETVQLTASESYSNTGDEIEYEWEIISAPEGSTAELSDSQALNTSFVADLEGEYRIQLVIKDDKGGISDPDVIVISTYNTAPVADASVDQSVTVVGDTVTLDASESFDEDGDSLDYDWSFVAKPEGSTAELSDPNAPDPSFEADVAGTYELVLVVTDEFGASSEPVTVIISFDNVAPVARAATGDTSVPMGEAVYLDGSGSSDANGDPLTYKWSIASRPEGSATAVEPTTGDETRFVPDAPGTYVVSLIVNDGLLNSTPSNVTIVAVVTQDSTPIQLLNEALSVIDELRDEDFKPGEKRKALTDKILDVIEKLDEGKIRNAVEKLSSDVMAKTDGCAANDIPDHNDWLVNCGAQGELFPLLFGALASLAPELRLEGHDDDGDDEHRGHRSGYGYHCIQHALEHSQTQDEFVTALMGCIRDHWHGEDHDHESGGG